VYTPHTSSASPLLFLYCYGLPRHLHSFPTRRSSDLSSFGSIPGSVTRQTYFLASLSTYASTAGVMLKVFLNSGSSRLQGFPVRIDRKSTRLNSSHRTISYAVFCLKKKTIPILMLIPV